MYLQRLERTYRRLRSYVSRVELTILGVTSRHRTLRQDTMVGETRWVSVGPLRLLSPRTGLNLRKTLR